MKKHNGDIRIESKVDEGTKFIITLPEKQIKGKNNSTNNMKILK